MHLVGIIFHNTELATSSGVSLKALKDSKESGTNHIIQVTLLDSRNVSLCLNIPGRILLVVLYY